MKRVSLALLLIGVGLVFPVSAQSDEFAFVRYLISKKNYDEAVYVLNALDQRSAGQAKADTVHYLLGNIYYNQQDLGRSIAHFDSVTGAVPRLKSESVFFSSFNRAYLRSFGQARAALVHYAPPDSALAQLKNFQLAGIALLERNVPAFDSLNALVSKRTYLLQQQQENLGQHRQRIVTQPSKSPVLAAMLSAIVPGAGKFYAGQKGQGIYTLLITGMVGLQAWEGYEKAGPKSFRFIAYSTLFASLYIGTVWGSAFTVKFRKDQLNETIDNQILFDMHIPIRTFFH